MDWKIYWGDLQKVTPKENEKALEFCNAFKSEFDKIAQNMQSTQGKLELGLDDLYVAFINGVEYAKSVSYED